ncbi:DUF115 domain-containing protein [Dehalococcoidia bacterium]|nr:DUF115 domain-containing protein [Dehalococcoidia bacterium]
MLEKIAGYIPQGLKEKIPGYYYWSSLYFRIPSKYYLYYKHILEKLRDIHKGQRCFIIGTGPSLNNTNLSLLKDEIIFGVNTLYRGISRFGINCNYYAVSDEVAWQEHFENVLGLDTVLFLSGRAGKSYLSNVNFFQRFKKGEPIVIRQFGPMWISKRFSKDLSTGAYWGSTVIIDICLQAAYHMGFKEVYLLGCDCDYSGAHRFDGLISERKSTPPIKGDFSRIFQSYEVCKKAYEEDGREIINATVGGKLEVFKRRKLEEII